jgi:phosphoribosylglycinamide formyltransferase-1
VVVGGLPMTARLGPPSLFHCERPPAGCGIGGEAQYRHAVIVTPGPTEPAERHRLGVLASGTGTILTAVIDAGIEVDTVIVDRPCRAEKLAADAGITVVTLERTSFGADFDRVAYTERVIAALVDRPADAGSIGGRPVDTVAMAGFGTILSPRFFVVFAGRVLNTHPALLPAFKGWHAVEAALAAGVKVSGCTVHLATAVVDDGPILAQQAVIVEPGDTAETLHERIKAVERTLYPETIRRFLEGAAL